MANAQQWCSKEYVEWWKQGFREGLMAPRRRLPLPLQPLRLLARRRTHRGLFVRRGGCLVRFRYWLSLRLVSLAQLVSPVRR